MNKIILRSSFLRDALIDPARIKVYLHGGTTTPTASMSLGTAAHCFLLQPEKFQQDYQVITDGRSKEGKEAKISGKATINLKDAERLLQMKERLIAFHEARNFTATEVLLHGTKELLIEHETELYIHTGEIDALDIEKGIIVDYKTTSAPSVYHVFWEQQVSRYYLHLQMAYYAMLYQLKFGKKAKKFYHVVQSIEAPYVVSCFEVGKEAMETGNKQIESAIKTIAAMIEEDSDCRIINVSEDPASPYHPGPRDVYSSYH